MKKQATLLISLISINIYAQISPLKDLKSGIPMDVNSKGQDITDFVDGKVFKCRNERDNWLSYYKFDVVNKNIYKIQSSFELQNSRIKFNNNSLISENYNVYNGGRILYATDKNISNVVYYSMKKGTLTTSASGGETCTIIFLMNIEKLIKAKVEEAIVEWQKKGEFEKTVDYQQRVNETSREKMINSLQSKIIEEYKKNYISSLDFDSFILKKYDADNETYLMKSEIYGDFVINVPIKNAPNFKNQFNKTKFSSPRCILNNNKFVLTSFEVSDNKGNKYKSNNNLTYSETKIDYNFTKLELELPDQTILKQTPNKQTNTISVGKADVDINIPINPVKNKSKYALVIGNEDYSSKQTSLSNEIDVKFARNDAESFKNYLVKTLGFVDEHVILLKDATSGEMSREIERLTQLAKLDSKAEIMFYYAGHGLPDDNKNPYLIPVDVSSINLEQNGVSLKNLYAKLGSSQAQKITVVLDACFSGGGRDQGLLAARGLKIRPKEEVFIGNMVVFASSSGEEKSLPYDEKQHGMFTYFLLKKLQESKGNVSYDEMSGYLKSEVARKSLISKSLQQTPHTNISRTIGEEWKNWSFR